MVGAIVVAVRVGCELLIQATLGIRYKPRQRVLEADISIADIGTR